mgnify:FL=1
MFSTATLETAQELRIIDDALFRLIAEKPNVCQEILRALLDMPGLTVIEVHAQQLIKSLHREVILDALCVLEDGSYANIEMQKSDENDDIARTRFHASAITAQRTPKGTAFKDVPNVTILYITEYDALGNNQTVTHVSRCMKVGNNYIPLNDGEDIIFANTLVDDGSDKAELLQLMLRKDSFYNDKFPAISSAMNYFKDTEGGRSEMCKSVEIYAQKVCAEERAKTITTLLRKGKTPVEVADLLDYDLAEVKEVEQTLLATAE